MQEQYANAYLNILKATVKGGGGVGTLWTPYISFIGVTALKPAIRQEFIEFVWSKHAYSKSCRFLKQLHLL